MRYLIIADMHGNWDALTAVLAAARAQGFEQVLVLGDLVGYGATPNEIVEEIGRLDEPWRAIRGNHDKVVAGIDDGLNFNPTALSAARWTSGELTEANLEFVRDLPQGPMRIETDLMICHGSLLDEDEYLLAAVDAAESLYSVEDQVTFFGHTHIPSKFAYREDDGHMEVAVLEGDQVVVNLVPGTRYMLNPGSVGQPRDRDPRAGYMIYDTEAKQVTLNRLEYPIEQAQDRIRAAGLPGVLADRLSVGI
jgi:predicted phosphodiesterase